MVAGGSSIAIAIADENELWFAALKYVTPSPREGVTWVSVILTE
jgi:hypothetical protein